MSTDFVHAAGLLALTLSLVSRMALQHLHHHLKMRKREFEQWK
jgi:hypothetical protein